MTAIDAANNTIIRLDIAVYPFTNKAITTINITYDNRIADRASPDRVVPSTPIMHRVPDPGGERRNGEICAHTGPLLLLTQEKVVTSFPEGGDL